MEPSPPLREGECAECRAPLPAPGILPRPVCPACSARLEREIALYLGFVAACRSQAAA